MLCSNPPLTKKLHHQDQMNQAPIMCCTSATSKHLCQCRTTFWMILGQNVPHIHMRMLRRVYGASDSSQVKNAVAKGMSQLTINRMANEVADLLFRVNASRPFPGLCLNFEVYTKRLNWQRSVMARAGDPAICQ